MTFQRRLGMRPFLSAAFVAVLLASAAWAQPAWTVRLAQVATGPRLLDLPLGELNQRLGGLFSIRPAPEGGCVPPSVVSGEMVLEAWAVVARHGDACEQRDGLQLLSVTVAAADSRGLGDAFAQDVTALAGTPCYQAVEPASTIRFWALRDRLISAAAAGPELTISLSNLTLAQSDMDNEREFARQFGEVFLGGCAARMAASPR